ncbi:MAG: dioxygenase [Alphaproteobacteria bacterium]|nr:dioxygenase [Alphaproteobacteria bacterium]MCB9695408.1 dioxygenase [Alphaproteobacteria bacterium]
MSNDPTRRALLAGTTAAAACAVAGGSVTPGTARQPAIYLPHGGGPWPFVDVGFGDRAQWDGLRAWLEALPASLPEPPKAILVISAHWEEPVPTLMTSASPPMLYDYYGFPPASYTITWPAPGAPLLANRVSELLAAAGLPSATDTERGFDHGTFVPLKVAWPGADVPTLQLSLVRGLDPSVHLAIGRALAPLRDEGVVILGSGMSFHNMRGFGPAGRGASEAFDAWMAEACAQPTEERDRRLSRWTEAPAARACHPREEHLLPLMVVAGSAGGDPASVPFRDQLLGVLVSAVRFG